MGIITRDGMKDFDVIFVRKQISNFTYIRVQQHNTHKVEKYN